MGNRVKKKIMLMWFLLAIGVGATPKSILLICVDDLRPELKCFGAEYIHSPNIDRLAAQGRAFFRHYANAAKLRPIALHLVDRALRRGQ